MTMVSSKCAGLAAQLLVGCGVLLLLLPAALCVNEYDWQWGRATYYGDQSEGDPANFHTGSCGYGYLKKFETNPNFHVMAVPDHNRLYDGACGQCFQVRCIPGQYKDNWGRDYDRSSACYDPNKIVTFVVTDECPCRYNNQWCCGDSHHFDLGYTGFRQLAPMKWGTISIQLRKVECPPDFKLGCGGYFGKGRRKLSMAQPPTPDVVPEILENFA